MYTSGSNRYQQGPSNPIYGDGSTQKNYNYATTPAARTITERPDHVVIQPVDGAATYIFGYGGSTTYCTASVGGTDEVCGTSGSAVTGSVVIANNDVPVKLDINPIWWDQSNNAAAGTTGEVTFVYSKQDK